MTKEPEHPHPDDADDRLVSHVRIASPRLPLLRVPHDWYRHVGSSRTVHRVVETEKNQQGEEKRTIYPGEFRKAISRRVLDIAKVNAAASAIGEMTGFDRSMRAMLLVEAHFLESLPPSTAVLDVLASAWSISDTVAADEAVADNESDHGDRHQRRVRARLQDWPDVASATDEAATLTDHPMIRARRVALHRIVRWFMRHGQRLTLPVREAIAKATGLLNREGNWRDEVIFAQQRMVNPEIFIRATPCDRLLLDQTQQPRIRDPQAFAKAIAIAADAVRASEFAKRPEKLSGPAGADWLRDRENFVRRVPPAKEVAKAVGVREATIRDWRKRSDWPDQVVLCAISQKVWSGNRNR
jgi:hypothetical protein